MTRFFAKYFSIIILLLITSSPLRAAPETWTLDPQHTYVLWKIEHLGFSTQAGKFYANGTVILDQDNPQKSSVNATIKIADIVTGIPDLDKHLKGQLFFNDAKFPTATFVSNKVEILNKNEAKVQGILTLHGVSKPTVLLVTMNKTGKNPVSDKITAGFTATTELKRSDFGMSTLLPDVGNTVNIEIGAEANK
jgi:polyisoprenoid-binding protein YceI